ncbi:MAG: thioredoxin domain-containing protein [Burkholderiales bacterium]|nr:thioredoxin domain-containing protein [Burkholderiales bacterium]
MPNRLAGETSPYLQQHAENPVDWYPWGAEALAKARAEDKPILLSIGYSACHWCHVMAHECFEDAEVAAAMNRDFVNVKVDREERPDLDQIYQTAHALLTQRSGGWPLTMFLTPDQNPFFGGTYFPKRSRYNLPGFLDLLPRIAEAFHTKGAAIGAQNASLLAALASTVPQAPAATSSRFDPAILDVAVKSHRQSFDPVHGGFGDAPKFSHPAELALCLRRGVARGDEAAIRVATHTLEKMAEGGIYDQLGGGFCRYSVDTEWTIPHFEKMLYDNAQLLALIADAWLVTRKPLFERVAEQTVSWIRREMQSPAGAYYSTLDADSEHEEGKYYVWTPDEVRAVLTAEEYAVMAPHYGLDRPANFEGRYWHLRVSRPLLEVAASTGRPLAECERLLTSARTKLFQVREQRVRPGRDEKILTSWNGLMIAGMARAARVFGRDDWLESAVAALDFLRGRMWSGGRLLATSKDGRAHLNAYLDDYAFLLAGVLELLETRWRSDDLAFACRLADALLDKFEDAQTGGFAFTSRDHEALIMRPKPGHDNATPSGNGVAAFALQRLGHLVGESRYLAASERTLRLFQSGFERQPTAYSSLLTALDEQLAPPRIVVLRGARSEVEAWRRALARIYRPATLVFAIPADATALPQVLAKPVAGAGVAAWVCEGASCGPPIATLSDLERLIDRAAATPD